MSIKNILRLALVPFVAIISSFIAYVAVFLFYKLVPYDFYPTLSYAGMVITSGLAMGYCAIVGGMLVAPACYKEKALFILSLIFSILLLVLICRYCAYPFTILEICSSASVFVGAFIATKQEKNN